VNIHLFLWLKLNLSSLLQFSVSHDPPQITLIWGSDDQHTVMIIISHFSVETEIHLISQNYLMNRKFKRTEFIWNIIFCNIINVFTDTFGQFTVHTYTHTHTHTFLCISLDTERPWSLSLLRLSQQGGADVHSSTDEV